MQVENAIGIHLPVLLNVGNTVYLEAGYFDGNKSPKYSDNLPYKAKTILKGSIISVYLKFVRVKSGVDGKTVKIRKDSMIKEIDDDGRISVT